MSRCFWRTMSRAWSFSRTSPANTVEVRIDASEPFADESHFFVAVCAHRPLLENSRLFYIPRSGNVLRERERHIAALDREIGLKNRWLEQAQADLAAFAREHQELLGELERSNRWANELNARVAQREARIVELQDELSRDQENARAVVAGYNAKIASLEEEGRETVRAMEEQRNTEVESLSGELAQMQAAADQLQKELEARTVWALGLEKERLALEHQMALVRLSRWMRLGRKIGLGPIL